MDSFIVATPLLYKWNIVK